MWPMRLCTSPQNITTEYREKFSRSFPHSRALSAEEKRYRKNRRKAEWSHHNLWEDQEEAVSGESSDSGLYEDQSLNEPASYRTIEIDQTGGSQCKIGVPALDIEALQSPDYRIARKPLSNRRTVEHFKESVLRENKSTQTELIKEDIEKLIEQYQSVMAKHRTVAESYEKKRPSITDEIALSATVLRDSKPIRDSRPPFAMYGCGDKELCMTKKRTFNVRAGEEVYKSALNAARLKAITQMHQQCYHVHFNPVCPRLIRNHASTIMDEYPKNQRAFIFY